MDPVWESLHATQEWGKYPAEDLIRTLMRRYKHVDRSSLKALEIGCGAGANLSFLLNENFNVAGIDGAPSAIAAARSRLVGGANAESRLQLREGNFTCLPWEEDTFDVVIDYFALYANRLADIRATLEEVRRVLKPGGGFYSRCWGKGTDGDQSDVEIEPGTLHNPRSGPCANMGLSHFFDQQELIDLYSGFTEVSLRKVITEELDTNSRVVEWCVWAQV